MAIIAVNMLTSRMITAEPSSHLKSAWAINQVIIDGERTNSKEWDESNRLDLYIGTNFGKSPPYLPTRIWSKNDETYLYMLIRIRYPQQLFDLEDYGYINYLWPDKEQGKWPQSDSARISQMNPPMDLFNYTGTTWQKDGLSTPPGENNVIGMGHFNGYYYWFEMRKKLNSNDGRDWTLEQGDTIGWKDYPPERGDQLIIGLYDHSKGLHIENYILLMIAQKPNQVTQTVGGTIYQGNNPIKQITPLK